MCHACDCSVRHAGVMVQLVDDRFANPVVVRAMLNLSKAAGSSATESEKRIVEMAPNKAANVTCAVQGRKGINGPESSQSDTVLY